MLNECDVYIERKDKLNIFALIMRMIRIIKAKIGITSEAHANLACGEIKRSAVGDE
jgi:hypothetical protein